MATTLYPALKKVGEEFEQLTLNELIKRIRKETIEATMEFMDELYKDTYLLYDKCIDQYYQYCTRRYSRHDVGRGTGTGSNLYRGAEVTYKGNVFTFEFTPSDMAGYKPYKNADGEEIEVDTDFVLSNVVNGIRGLPYSASRLGGDSMTWSASVSSKLFGNLSGSIDDILRTIESKFPDIATEYIVNRVLKNLGYK